MPRKTITQPAAARAESPITDDELTEARQLVEAARVMATTTNLSYGQALSLLAEAGEYVGARAEVKRLREQLAAITDAWRSGNLNRLSDAIDR